MRKGSSIDQDAKGQKGQEDSPTKKTKTKSHPWTEAESDKDHCLLLVFSNRLAFVDGFGHLLSIDSHDICRASVDANMLTVVCPPNNPSSFSRYHGALLKEKVVVLCNVVVLCSV